MAISITGYSQFPLNILKNLINDLSDNDTTIKCALYTSSYTPNQETHESYADLTNEVAEGSGYTTGGVELTSKTVTEATRVTAFDCINATWSSSTMTARGGIVYDDTPALDADKKLICWIDFGENKSSENGTFEIQFDAAGLFTMTVPA